MTRAAFAQRFAARVRGRRSGLVVGRVRSTKAVDEGLLSDQRVIDKQGIEMQVAVLTFDGFNELDSFISAAIINRCRRDGLTAYITTPTPVVTSMNGVEVTGQRSFDFIPEADVVLVGSGIRTRDVVADDRLITSIPLDPTRQLIGSQCSGALVLARLGMLESIPACTDTISRPWVEGYGVEVLDAPFHAVGNIATAGGCLASQYLAAWVISQTLGETVARAVIHYVAPVGEKNDTVERVFSAVRAGDRQPAAQLWTRT